MNKNNVNAAKEEILKWMRELKFKKKLIGGIDEDDVLKKMEELNSLYEAMLTAERMRYNELLAGQTEEGKKHDGK